MNELQNGVHAVGFGLIALPSLYPTVHEMHASSFVQHYSHLGSDNEPVCDTQDGHIIAVTSHYLPDALEAMQQTFLEMNILRMVREGHLGDACSQLLDFHCELATVIRGTGSIYSCA